MAKRFQPSHIRKRRRIAIIAVVIASSLLALGGFFWYYRRESSKPVWLEYTNNSLGILIEYPSTFVEYSLDVKAKKAGYIWEIKRQKPAAVFSLRYEGGLGPLSAVKGSVLTALVDGVNRRYPSRFPNYKKESYAELVLANEKAARFDFTYTGADGQTRVKQRLFIVVKDNSAYYLSAQAPEKEFKRSEKDLDRIIGSFKFL